MSPEEVDKMLGKIMRTGPTLVAGKMKATAGECWPFISGLTWTCIEWKQFEYSTWRNKIVKLKNTENRIWEIEKQFLDSADDEESNDDSDTDYEDRKRRLENLISQLKKWKFEVLRIKVHVEPENESTKKEYEKWHKMRGQGQSAFLEETITWIPFISKSEKSIWPYSNDR